MDNASVVTYAGDTSLFEDLENSLVQAIPKDPTEWRRPYGRAVKSVYLDASFVPFAKESVPKQGSYKLIAQPILHTFWTECNDIETYRNTVKSEIEQWLKQVGNADWMVVLVEVYDIRKSNKLLPRTTVIDKLRADFAVKQGDRVVGLIHPIKSESKSAESWRGLVNRMRVLILSAYTKTLSAFEEAIRANRECRPQPSWSYCSYFAMQEELALVYEMLGLHDEALVQYDELDALFTQFVVNSAKGDTPKWLASFSVPLQHWAGPTLCQRVTPSQRDLLRCSKLDLLQFRSYLFGRQCSLLFLLVKPQEVAQRTASFLHNSVKEMKILEVSAPEGALATWVFLVCLEILQTCEKFVDSQLVQAYSIHTASLWAYARDKLKQLGVLCGLAPGLGPGPGPTSEQLHTVVQLSSGMGDPPLTSAGPTPVDRLKLALSSNEAYNNYFMELSELAISTYKHIGRMRFAKLIGIDLADLYLALGQPEKAASFLSLALQSALDDKWSNLAAHIHLRLVQCFSDCSPDIKYTMSCAAIASSDLESSIKIDYYNKFLTSIKRFAQGTPTVTNLGDIGFIKNLNIDAHHQICRGQCVINANIDLFLRLPGPLKCDVIRLSVEKGNSETSQQLDSTSQEIFTRLPIFEHVCYKEDGSFNGANIICREPQKALKRTDSQGRKVSAPLRKDFSSCLSARNIVLQPGMNNINLSWTAENVGRYLLGQLNVTVSGVEFLDLVAQPSPQFLVEQKKSSVTIRSTENALLAGIPQNIELFLDTGSYFIIQNTPMTVKCSSGLKAASENGELASSIEVILSETEPFEQLCIPLKVYAELPAQSDEEDPSVAHKISIFCGWCDVESITELSFLTPLRSVIRLHTVADNKLLQVTMFGLTNQNLLLRGAKLKAGNGVMLEDKNVTTALSTVIGAGLKSSFMWQLDVKTIPAEMDSVPLTFMVDYSAKDSESDFYKYKCHFGICNFKTLFVIKTNLEPGKDADFCRAGAICQLNITISRVIAQPETELAVMYEITADQHWGICGRMAGILTFEKETELTVILDVIPNTQGYLQVPNVRLHRYIPALDKESGRGEDSTPRMEPFTIGQVYYANRCEQVHILQAGVQDQGAGPRN